MFKKLFLLVTFALVLTSVVRSQNVIDINASRISTAVKQGQYHMGDPGPKGEKIEINNHYITIGGKPVLPVMGEVHYVRYPRNEWQDILLKMKADGIDIISTYVFWIYHEEIEGQFNWSGNRDLRAFLKLCQRDGFKVFVRIGPWCHGEVRNGGFPDWLLQKKYIHPRSDDPVFQHYVKQYFRQIGLQMKGMMYKDGGPVIGIQLENEYSGGEQGEKYIMWLKHTAIADGMNVPMYAVTGWGNASIPKDQVIPLWGGYPGAPWNPNLKKITNSQSFVFEDLRSSGNIFQGKRRKGYHPDTKIYPFFTVEMGVGNEITYHRRPVFSDIDGLSIAMTRLGSGANLLGYYMFAGGADQVGTLTTLEEDRKNTGYWNRYPIISYDFQAAIRETGELAPSYFQIKKLHYFVNEFGSRLAPMMPVIGPQTDPHKKLLYSVRTDGKSGYVFGVNYYRGFQKPTQKDVQFDIRLKSQRVKFPATPVNIPDSCDFIWPFNFRMNKVLMKYATAQPLCKINGNNATDWYFIRNRGINPEFSFVDNTVSDIQTSTGSLRKEHGESIISNIRPGLHTVITIRDKEGYIERVHVLSSEEAKHVWLFNHNGLKYLFLSDANLYMNHNRLHVYSKSNDMKITELDGNAILSDHDGPIHPKMDGSYSEYEVSVPKREISLSLEPHPVLSDAKWLKASVNTVNDQNELRHKFFVKEFNLGNPAAITSAKLIVYSEVQCNVKINNKWVNQHITSDKVNDLDITGYVKKGNNQFLLDFPFTAGDSAFAATVKVTYANSDQITFSTDQSWLTYQSYTYPAPWTDLRRLQKPDIVPSRKVMESNVTGYKQWTLTIPDGYLNGLNNLYLYVNYIGDRARFRLHYRLIDDNFNNGTTWHIGLKRYGHRLEGQTLKFSVYPLLPGYKIWFDRKPAAGDLDKAEITSIKAVPEYAKNLELIGGHIK